MEHQDKKKQRWIEISVFCIALALLALMFGVVKVNKKFVQRLNVKEIQVSSLIQELGEVRQENIFLQQKLVEQAENIGKLHEFLKTAQQETREAPEEEKTETEKIKRPGQERNINILVAGHHQKLTDTILIASLNGEKQKITLISIPRDIFVNGRKINEYYLAYGAIEFLRRIEEITGIKIDHYVVVSMPAFQEFIDALGGVEVNVERPLTDGFFPNDQGGYAPFSIPEGIHHFDGGTALKYARSRTGTSDFDRAKRQQKIIQAVLAKVRELNFLSDLSLTKKVYESVGSLFETNLGLLDILLLLQQFHDATINGGNVLSTENHLVSTRNLNGQYILLPKTGDFSEIQNYMSTFLSL